MFHARFVDYGYPPHHHDTWTVLIVDTGAISYALDRRQCGAFGQTVAILPPGVTHDGRPASGADGFTKRVLYLDRSVLPDDLVGPAVDLTNIEDRPLRKALVGLHHELAHQPDQMAADSSLAVIIERFAQHLGGNPGSTGAAIETSVAVGLRELLDAEALDGITLAQAAHRMDRSKAHLVRSFNAAYGIAPHAYVIAVRVEQARKLLLDGVAPAEVAAAVGFYDQSHLTRHFKRHTSVPPAAFAAHRPN